MFYYDGNRWRPFNKKVSYTQTVTEYDNDTSRFEGLDNLQITDNLLTDQELVRLEIIKNVSNMSLRDVINYVKGDELSEAPPAELVEAEERHQEREAIKSLINMETAPAEQILKMKILFKEYDPNGHFLINDLLEYDGKIYRVLQSHRAQADWLPDKTPALYALKITSDDGSPLPFVQPTAEEYYKLGDLVIFEGGIWESLLAVNTWSPSQYPAGWKWIREA